MTVRSRLAAAVALAALAACGSSSKSPPGALLAESSSVAVFRGVTLKTPDRDPALVSLANPYHPYVAIANAATNEISILDGVDDSLVAAPAVLRGLVYPVPGRPVLLAAGDLGDGKPDLLVVVAEGDLPGRSRLQVVETWAPYGRILPVSVELPDDVVALLPLDPDGAGSVKVVAALAGEQLAVVTFPRVAGSLAIDVAAAQASVVTSPALGFQPLQLAAVHLPPRGPAAAPSPDPAERSRVYAATFDPIGPTSVHGVAMIDLANNFQVTALDARAPTRLVAAGFLGGGEGIAAPDPSLFGTPVTRVYAVLDESGCGLDAAIGCGLVALDPATHQLVATGPTAATSAVWSAGFAAPIPVGHIMALGFSGPPVVAPPGEPQFAGTLMRFAVPNYTWATSGAIGVASSDGFLTFVDAGRWVVPSNQRVYDAVGAKVASTRPASTPGLQFLTLVLDAEPPVTIAHTDAVGLSTAVKVTGGYTPTDRWVVVHEGVLPGLSSRHAQMFDDAGTPAMALQVPGQPAQQVVRLWDPTLGVTAGDIVVIEPSGLGTCGTFEATVAELVAPSAAFPGGYARLGHRSPGVSPAVPTWDRCIALMHAASTDPAAAVSYLATIRAGRYVLLRGATTQQHVGRPEIGKRFAVSWVDEETRLNETDLAAICKLPPARAWPGLSPGGLCVGDCDCVGSCRDACERLVRSRLARRIGYVADPATREQVGPAIAFKLGLVLPRETTPPPRDIALVIDTNDGRAPDRFSVSAGFAVDPRGVSVFDRTPYDPAAGVRFLVPWAGGAVLDASPSNTGGEAVNTIH